MSAFQCLPSVIGKVLRVMEKDYEHPGRHVRRLWEHAERWETAARLITMNDAAIVDRYHQAPMSSDDRNTDANAAVKASEKDATNWGLLKALDCFLYQCNEGRIPEQFPLYVQLEQERVRLINETIQQLPEYQAAPYGV